MLIISMLNKVSSGLTVIRIWTSYSRDLEVFSPMFYLTEIPLYCACFNVWSQSVEPQIINPVIFLFFPAYVIMFIKQLPVSGLWYHILRILESLQLFLSSPFLPCNFFHVIFNTRKCCSCQQQWNWSSTFLICINKTQYLDM